MLKKIFNNLFEKKEETLNNSEKEKKQFKKNIDIEQICCLSWNALDDGYIPKRKLPESICNIISLKKLILGSTVEEELMEYKLDELPKSIKKLTNLEELHLQFNNLTYLPPEIGELENLKILKLGGNKLKTLPKEIAKLKQLELLTLWGNEIIDLPIEITNLTNLKGFSLIGNPVENNNKLTDKHIKWLIDLKNNGCKLELGYQDINALKTNEIKYKVEYYKNNDNYSSTYLSLKQIDSIFNYEIENGISYKKIKIYNGDNVFQEKLSEKYNDLLDRNRILLNIQNEDEEDEEYEDEEYEDEEYEDEEYLNKYEINYIYHITHYKNLKSILKNGLLCHYNNLTKEHIDNAEVNDRRNKKELIFNKNLHSYVPFYFNPKNSMLYVNKNIQDDIIILAFNRNLLMKEKTIFTDGNAASNRTNFFNDLEDLDKLNWKCLQSNYWNNFEDGKRLVMAEVLVPKRVKRKHLMKIYCYDKSTKNYILDLDVDLDVEINEKLYF